MTGTWATDWATNDVVAASEFRKSLGCVYDSTLGVAAATIDITPIPITYAHLLVVLYGRGDTAAASTTVLMRFNADSAANYDYQLMFASAATASASETFGSTSVPVGTLEAATAGANLFSMAEIVIPHYANAANNKTARSISCSKTGTSTGNLQALSAAMFWRSSAAINRLTFLPAAGNFAAGTRCSVYVMGS